MYQKVSVTSPTQGELMIHCVVTRTPALCYILFYIKAKVKVPIYSLISIFSPVQLTFFTPLHGATTRAQPAHADPNLDLCTRYPSPEAMWDVKLAQGSYS